MPLPLHSIHITTMFLLALRISLYCTRHLHITKLFQMWAFGLGILLHQHMINETSHMWAHLSVFFRTSFSNCRSFLALILLLLMTWQEVARHMHPGKAGIRRDCMSGQSVWAFFLLQMIKYLIFLLSANWISEQAYIWHFLLLLTCALIRFFFCNNIEQSFYVTFYSPHLQSLTYASNVWNPGAGP